MEAATTPTSRERTPVTPSQIEDAIQRLEAIRVEVDSSIKTLSESENGLLDPAARRRLEKLHETLAETIQALSTPDTELIDPLDDLARVQEVYELVDRASKALRHEAVQLRSKATAQAINAGATYAQVGDALGGIKRQRVHQIVTQGRDGTAA